MNKPQEDAAGRDYAAQRLQWSDTFVSARGDVVWDLLEMQVFRDVLADFEAAKGREPTIAERKEIGNVSIAKTNALMIALLPCSCDDAEAA